MSSMPFIWRWRLSVAASAERVWSKPDMAVAGGLLANAFPIAREAGRDGASSCLGRGSIGGSTSSSTPRAS